MKASHAAWRRSPVLTIRPQSGFTLVEVLVSALVIAIGLVGVAALQALALKNNQSTFMRSQATALAYDLADRMRANVSGADAGAYDPAAAAIDTSCNTNSGCAPDVLAEHDLAEWNASIAANLPAGQGYVCIDSTPDDGTGPGDAQCDNSGSQFSIKIWWDDDRDGTTSVTTTNNERLVIAFRL